MLICKKLKVCGHWWCHAGCSFGSDRSSTTGGVGPVVGTPGLVDGSVLFREKQTSKRDFLFLSAKALNLRLAVTHQSFFKSLQIRPKHRPWAWPSDEAAFFFAENSLEEGFAEEVMKTL